MAAGRADVERLAIPELAADLRAYVAAMSRGQESVARRVAAAEAAVERALGQARRDLAVAVEGLDACRRMEGADCGREVAGVDRARARLETVYSVAAELRSATAQHDGAARRFASALESISQAAQRDLGRAAGDLDVYLGRSHGSPTRAGAASPVSDRAAAGAGSLSRPAGFPEGVHLVPLAMIDDSDTRIRGVEDFSEFYTPADLEWAHEAFQSVIKPGVAAGATVDDFRARDQREGRMGARSYEMTFAGFFGTDAIKLSPAGSKLEVNNGYHRIWVARQMGLDAVPARVAGS